MDKRLAFKIGKYKIYRIKYKSSGNCSGVTYYHYVIIDGETGKNASDSIWSSLALARKEVNRIIGA